MYYFLSTKIYYQQFSIENIKFLEGSKSSTTINLHLEQYGVGVACLSRKFFVACAVSLKTQFASTRKSSCACKYKEAYTTPKK